jgi:autotransporter-associated beta strand protein
MGPIGGSGSLVKIGGGVLNLESNSVYSGDTIIANGTVALSAVGSISNTAAIDLVTTNSVLDLSQSTYVDGNGNPVLALQDGQTLSGFGTVMGLVQTVSGATIAPGSPAAVGVLTVTGFADTNVLNGTTLMKLDKGSLTNDQLSVAGSLAFGGTLALTNLSGSLAAGDAFTLFSAAGGCNGVFANITPSRPGYPAFGLAWNTNNLAVNGTLSMVSAPIPPPPTISSLNLSGTTLTIKGTNGLANEQCIVLQSTNLTTPLSNWVPVATNAFDVNGRFNVSISLTNGVPQQFFRLGMQ